MDLIVRTTRVLTLFGDYMSPSRLSQGASFIIATLTCTSLAQAQADAPTTEPASSLSPAAPSEPAPAAPVTPAPLEQPPPAATPTVPTPSKPAMASEDTAKNAQLPPHDTSEPAREAAGEDNETRHWQGLVHEKGVHLKVRVVVQPMLRYSHNSNLVDDNVDMIIRRARFGLLAKLPHHLRLKFEIQIKNMHFGLSNMYGAWAPNRDTEIYFGFIKAPGGLERDTYSFDEPFIERSVVAYLTYDHEMGAKVDGYFPGRHFAYSASITRNAPPAVDGGDPEDKPVYPQGVEEDDITRAASKWNGAARLQAIPSDRFEAGVTGGVRYRPDEPDFGDRAAEPYDTSFMDPKPYRGTSWHVSADAAASLPHFRLMAEGGFRRDGKQLTYVNNQVEQTLDGHLKAWLGYITAGFAPVGRYGAAAENAPLLSGFELVARVEGARITPVDQPHPVTFGAVTAGLHWEATRHLRLQWDYAYEVFGKHDVTPTTAPPNLNANARQWFAQFWATLRL